ncbi:dual specificity protein phosphatase family protein [Fimbriiglobus ruber]|uniref:Tyrosine specific protein phosphatases domain-containing protein n=1 Tax=Fimbriiglobus ruber TaxID=1908690 RepID=A0A225E3U4_9BACT|nr:dual specificity protein phosphatase [Fimbriiglobus ruber]OWK43355.1 hypothetical protein FRUB_02954 [Fimbriiglobus ruber]
MRPTRRSVLFVLLLLSLGAWVGLYAWERAHREDNYAEIEDGLYVGGSVAEPPVGTRAVLNLCEVDDPYRCPIHVWEPIRDAAPAPDLAWLKRQVDFIADQRANGAAVYVHCLNGVSRSVTVVTAYLMFERHWTRDEALAFVRTRRPIARPNRAFLDRLAEWEQVANKR